MKQTNGYERAINRLRRGTCVAWILAALVCGWSQSIQADSAAFPALSQIVLFGMLPPGRLTTIVYPEAGRSCFRKYLNAVAQNSYLRAFVTPSSPEEAVPARKRNLVEQMVVLLGPKVRKDAEAFADALPLSAEWEGMHEGPMHEATVADVWLQNHPGTAIAPFLYLFKAHRLRAAYEAAETISQKTLRSMLADQYRLSLSAATSCLNPLISCIADDLEAQDHVYLEGRGRP